jgi:hypothetical protein
MSKLYLLELTEQELENLQKFELKPSILSKIEQSMQDSSKELLSYNDYKNILSFAKDEWIKLPQNLRITNKEMEEKDLVHISLANALIMWFNKKNLLKKFVGFDFTDHSNEYDTIED